MARIRGPIVSPLPGEGEWPILNRQVFGSMAIGGWHSAPSPQGVPLNFEAIFGRVAPLTLEIGFNRGDFIRELALRRPDQDHLGIEIRRRFAYGVAHGLGQSGGPLNVRVIWGDAKLVAPAAFGDRGVADLFVLFPDPWWKKKHEKRRLIDESFGSSLIDLLAPGGSLWIKTDVPDIALEIREAVALDPRAGQPVPFEVDTLPLTRRERSCLASGRPIERFRFVKRLDEMSMTVQGVGEGSRSST